MTPPTRLFSFLCSLFGIKAILLPIHRIRIYIQPNLLIAPLIPDHMVMEGILPHRHVLFGFVNPLCHKRLILTNNHRETYIFSLQCKDDMNMIGHDHIFIQLYRRKVLFNISQSLLGDSSE